MTEYDIKYLQTKTDLETVTVNGLLLHSKYDPVQEASRIIDKEFIPGCVHILFGYGLGYLAESLYDKIEDKSKLIIVDPIYLLLPKNKIECKVIFDLEGSSFETELGNALKNFDKKVKVICSPNYDKLFPVEYTKVLKIIKDMQNYNIINENTLKIFAESWQENYIHNLFNIFKDESLESIKKFYSCPVVIASGGPSLTKQIPLLKKIQNQVVLIAAGSTINSLLKNEIEPDYIITVDGSLENYNHFKNIKNIKSKLIYALTSHYQIQNEFKNEKYAFVDKTNIDYKKHVKNLFSIELPLITGGGSVANFALSIASYITTGPIAIIGQDLAYTDNKTHADDNKNSRNIDSKFKNERGLIEVTGYNGEKVLTDYVFLSMKKSFELINMHTLHDAGIFNCTEGGIKIEGMEQISFSYFIEKYTKNKKVVKKDREIGNKLLDINTFNQIIRTQISIYDDLIKDLNIALVTLDKNKSKVSFDTKVLNKLGKLDKVIHKKIDELALNYIANPITIDVLKNYEPNKNETPVDSYKRVYAQNKELYSRLLLAIEKTKQYTLDMLQKNTQ